MKTVDLVLTSWVGTSAIGAMHYYGRLVWRNPASTDWKDRNIEHELRRLMTRKEIAIANKEMREDGYKGAWLNKDNGPHLTRGFYSYDEVRAFAIKTAAELFKGEEYILCERDTGCLSASPLLAYPERYRKQAERINALAEEWHRIGGYEGNEKRAREIDKEWFNLMKEIDPTI